MQDIIFKFPVPFEELCWKCMECSFRVLWKGVQAPSATWLPPLRCKYYFNLHFVWYTLM